MACWRRSTCTCATFIRSLKAFSCFLRLRDSSSLLVSSWLSILTTSSSSLRRSTKRSRYSFLALLSSSISLIFLLSSSCSFFGLRRFSSSSLICLARISVVSPFSLISFCRVIREKATWESSSSKSSRRFCFSWISWSSLWLSSLWALWAERFSTRCPSSISIWGFTSFKKLVNWVIWARRSWSFAVTSSCSFSFWLRIFFLSAQSCCSFSFLAILASTIGMAFLTSSFLSRILFSVESICAWA